MAQTVELRFRWALCPKFGVKQECFLGKFRLGAIWYDNDRMKWCAYFDNDHSTERTYDTESEAKAMVETRAVETFLAA